MSKGLEIIVNQSKPILVIVSISLSLARVLGKLIFAAKLSGQFLLRQPLKSFSYKLFCIWWRSWYWNILSKIFEPFNFSSFLSLFGLCLNYFFIVNHQRGLWISSGIFLWLCIYTVEPPVRLTGHLWEVVVTICVELSTLLEVLCIFLVTQYSYGTWREHRDQTMRQFSVRLQQVKNVENY